MTLLGLVSYNDPCLQKVPGASALKKKSGWECCLSKSLGHKTMVTLVFREIRDPSDHLHVSLCHGMIQL